MLKKSFLSTYLSADVDGLDHEIFFSRLRKQFGFTGGVSTVVNIVPTRPVPKSRNWKRKNRDPNIHPLEFFKDLF